ncbi:MAG: cytochrome C oxidase subunit II [Bacteroidia bacterium]|nr:cytochrome C oxidase subunit II [Bacteroidia bacterium]MCX7651279.1 cytochrome C oxidase subunit II [Bacteroidia bacterium]MDW8416227.1 cytochrome C oxidase subunit II [Bacteroidia bacterium]
MDRVEKITLMMASGLLGLFFLALLAAAKLQGINVPPCLPPDVKPFSEGRVDTLPDGRRQLFYVARMWRFEPEVVEVPVNKPVDIFLSAADVTHGFYVSWTNTNLMAIPGTVNAYTLKLEKPGVYPIICHEYCGSAHQNMVAYLVAK